MMILSPSVSVFSPAGHGRYTSALLYASPDRVLNDGLPIGPCCGPGLAPEPAGGVRPAACPKSDLSKAKLTPKVLNPVMG